MAADAERDRGHTIRTGIAGEVETAERGYRLLSAPGTAASSPDA